MVRLEQLLKALFRIDMTDDGIVICVRFLQSLKTLFPIDVADDGIVICFRFEHLKKVIFYLMNSVTIRAISILY